jgi:hypothetical protein
VVRSLPQSHGADRPHCHRGIFFSWAKILGAFGTSYQEFGTARNLPDCRTTSNSMCCRHSAASASSLLLALIMLRFVIEAIFFRAAHLLGPLSEEQRTYIAVRSGFDAVDGAHSAASRCHRVVALEQPHWGEPSMSEVSTIGLDIAKSVFQVHGVDVAGGL